MRLPTLRRLAIVLAMAGCTLWHGSLCLGFCQHSESDVVERSPCATHGNTLHRYLLPEAGTFTPYRAYVPARYDGRVRLPLIVILHGRGLDENSPLANANGLLTSLSEERGYIIVSPLGLHKDAGFGQRYRLVIGGKVAPSDVDERTATLSELDVMSVLNRVVKDCKVDQTRIYLAGHSMGGLGAWYLGAKYNNIWAGIAVMAAGVLPSDYPLERLNGIPLIVTQGTADVLSRPEDARIVIRRMQRQGLRPTYVEIVGATHSETYERSLGTIFDFFDAHQRSVKGE